MTAIVVDASVVIKWFVPELGSEAAQRMLQQDHEYLAPDLLFAEIGNVVWKKVRKGELTEKDGLGLINDLSTASIESVPTPELVADAYALAVASGRTVYDALYLALAIRLKTLFVTADERLFNALANIPMTAAHIRLLGTFA